MIYPLVEDDLFMDETQVPELEPGIVVMVLLLAPGGDKKEWVPCTISGMTLSRISRSDLNEMNEHLSIHSGNLWESGYFSNRRYSLTYHDEDADAGAHQEMLLYFITRDVIGMTPGDDTPGMDTTGMTRGDVKQMLKNCSRVEQSGPNAGRNVAHTSCAGLAYDPVSRRVVLWRDATPIESSTAPEYAEAGDDVGSGLAVTPRRKRRVISDEVDDTFNTKRVRWPTDGSLERIREIPGLDRQFRDEYRGCNACVRGFTDYKGDLINPDMGVGELLASCVVCLNDIMRLADTRHAGKVGGKRAREMTQKKCFQPMAGTIARHPGLSLMVTNFVSDRDPRVSRQLRSDFMSILRSAFRFHGKTVTDHVPADVPLHRQLHVVRLHPHERARSGVFALKINQVGAAGDPVVLTSP